MKPAPYSEPKNSAPIRLHSDSGSKTSASTKAPHEGLKQAALSLKDSGIGFIQAKTELAAIEAKEAAAYAKKKITIGIITAFFATFSYVLFLVLAYGMILQYAGQFISKVSSITTLNDSNTVILLLLLANLLVSLIFLLKLSKKPQEEFFPLTKSEFQKDKQWLAEINQTHGN